MIPCSSQISTLIQLTYLGLEKNLLHGPIPSSVSWQRVADEATLCRTMYTSLHVVTCLVLVVVVLDVVNVSDRCARWPLSMNGGVFKICHKGQRIDEMSTLISLN